MFCRDRWRIGFNFGLTLLLVLSMDSLAVAQTTRTWNTGSGNWATSSNWTPSGVPGAGDSVVITSPQLTFTVTYDYSGANVSLNKLTLEEGGTALISHSATLSMSAHLLTATTESIGDSSGGGSNGVGIFNLSGGTNNAGLLFLGFNSSDKGTYNLSGTGVLGSGVSGTNEFIGDSGRGTFSQTAGINSASSIKLGNFGGSNGAYTLSGGTLSVTTSEVVGLSGTGSVQQSGGTSTIGATLSVGDGNDVNGSPASGDYSLSGTGTLSAHDEIIGKSGTGTFEQSASTNTITATLSVGSVVNSTGSYTLSGGTLTASQELVGDHGAGSVTHSAGSNVLTTGSLILGNSAGGSGTYNLSGTGAVTGDVVVGATGTGVVNQTGGTLTTIVNNNQTLEVGQNSTGNGMYTLSGGTLQSHLEYIGHSGAGTFSQSNGSNIATALYIGYDLGSSGAYTLSGGELSADGAEGVGESGTGTFTQTGGTHYAHSLTIGGSSGSSGTFTLSGDGELHSDDSQYVGYGGTGIFTQTGGMNNTNALTLGSLVGAAGAYSLSGGTLAVTGELQPDTEIVGDAGTGTFNQTGGTHSIDSFGSTAGILTVGHISGSTGTYTLSDGSLTVGSLDDGNFDDGFGTEIIGDGGNGTFIQTGGTNTILAQPLTNTNNGIYIGDGAGSIGTYALSGGVLRVLAKIRVGSNGTGMLNHTGGMIQTDGLALGENIGSTGTYNLSGTGLLLATDEYLGISGVATFNQTGGTNTVALQANFSTPAMFLGSYPNGTGNYTISGGSANIGGSVYVGGREFDAGGTGVLTVSGTGVFSVADTLKVYNTAGTSVNLNGGTIAAQQLNFNGTPSLLHWTSGTLNITSDVAFDSFASPTSTSTAFGSALTLNNNQTLLITGNETLGGAGPFALTLNSGSSHTTTDGIYVKTNGILTVNPGYNLDTPFVDQQGGVINGTLINTGNFAYESGQFNGRLINEGQLSIVPHLFVLADGLENDTTVFLLPNQTLTANGQGLDNLGQFLLQGGTLSGNGPAVNDYGGTMQQSYGTINSAFTNRGQMIVAGVLRLNGGATNVGKIQGLGTVQGSITNGTGGLIQPGDPYNGTGAENTLAFTSFQGNNAGGSIQLPAGLQLNISNTWTNAGLVTLGGNTAGSSAVLGGGGAITNTGTIQGAGLVTAPIANSSGTIRASGGELDLAGAGSTNATSASIQAATGNTVMMLQGLAVNAGTIGLTGGVFDNNNHTLSNTGTINGYGTLRTSGLTNTGKINVGEGNLDVFGNVTNNGTIGIQGGRSAYFFGNENGAGSFTGVGAAVFLAAVSPGNSPASVSFGGDANLTSASELDIELGGTTPGTQYDQLLVTGQLSLGGTLNVLLTGLTPAAGQSFDILDWGNIVGAFSAISLPTLAGGLTWNTTQLYTAGVLSIASVGLPGDYNLNGTVDAADYVVWRKGLGTTYTQTDYDVWRANFGQTAGSGAGASANAAVPEPATLVLSIIAMLTTILFRQHVAYLES